MKKLIRLLIMLGFCLPVLLYGANDPTKPDSITDVSGDSTWDLTAIYVSPSRKVAVMHDEFVMVGSKVNDAEVIAIFPDYVLLRSAEGVLKVSLVNSPIKQIKK